MAGFPAPEADARVALKAVASIDRLIASESHDVFLKEILKSAAGVLRDPENRATDIAPTHGSGRPTRLH